MRDLAGRNTRFVAVLALLAACGSAFAGPPQIPPPTPPAVVSRPPDFPRASFADWLAGVRAEALARGIRPEIVADALKNIDEPLPVVLDRDRAQTETVLTLEQYITRRVRPTIVRTGRETLERHRALAGAVADRYGVPATIVVGIWGLESNFGQFSGVRPTIAALATLAWDGRRAAFFRGELLSALEILNRGDIKLADLRGSWAGAMGQTQFMPSSYLRYAEDYDGDGRRDIWSTTPDVLASIANYLKGHGWTTDQGWGREVKMTDEAARQIAGQVERRAGTCRATRDMTVALPVARWHELGVRLTNGQSLPAGAAPMSLVSGATRRFLVTANYDVLLAYNCAHAYAVSVGLLADELERP